VRRIIREILVLLWKLLRLVFWKWLRPRLGRIMTFTALFIGFIILVVFLLTRL
jgi:hypothetical protein